jgi:hypothetical protein
LRISGARKSVVSVTGANVVCLAHSLRSSRREIRNRAEPRERDAVFLVQHLFCSILGNAILDFAPRAARYKLVEDRRGPFSKQSI